MLFPDELKVSRSLRKRLRADTFEVSFDRAFETVIERCAEPRQAQGRIESGTWITPAMRAAYCQLHKLGFAHSVETWQDRELVGGLYGVSLGAMFFGESMFTRATDASKVALVGLVGLARAWHFSLIDCQVANPHLASLGARSISRKDFLARVRDNLTEATRRGSWREERPADP